MGVRGEPGAEERVHNEAGGHGYPSALRARPSSSPRGTPPFTLPSSVRFPACVPAANRAKRRSTSRSHSRLPESSRTTSGASTIRIVGSPANFAICSTMSASGRYSSSATIARPPARPGSSTAARCHGGVTTPYRVRCSVRSRLSPTTIQRPTSIIHRSRLPARCMNGQSIVKEPPHGPTPRQAIREIRYPRHALAYPRQQRGLVGDQLVLVPRLTPQLYTDDSQALKLAGDIYDAAGLAAHAGPGRALAGGYHDQHQRARMPAKHHRPVRHVLLGGRRRAQDAPALHQRRPQLPGSISCER